MATYNKFNSFVADLCQKKHDLSAPGDALWVCLTATLPVNTNTILSNITQLPAGNGYTVNGALATTSSSSQTTGTFKIVCANVTFTAAGGTVGPLRYAVLYNTIQTVPLKPLIAWWDYGSAITLNDTETFTVAFDQTNGVFQLS
jgi:hypothetical protein